MRSILLLIASSLILAFANDYTIYDINGKNQGSFNGNLNKHKLTKLVKEYHGSILVQKKTGSSKNLDSSHLNLAQLIQIKKTIVLSQDSLEKENWFEVEKNEIVKICLDKKAHVWETSLKASIFNDTCLVIQAPTLIGVESINVYNQKNDKFHKISLAIGMKYLNFKNEEVFLGYNNFSKEREKIHEDFKNEDPERLVYISGTYLIDKYPVTNCEFTQLMWDSIPEKSTIFNESIRRAQEDWISRKKNSIHNKNCITHDSAASTVSLYQALKYANARSVHDGLKPYYLFSKTNERKERIISENQYIVKYMDFEHNENEFIQVSADKKSDGYRLPYYDEWMMFARGGDKKNKAPWGDSSATFEEALKYARFNTTLPNSEKKMYYTEPVGQQKPNGYGIYDIFGLVEEHVILKKYLSGNFSYPSCKKGGGYYVNTNDDTNVITGYPNWKEFNYGYYYPGHSGVRLGFRLVRNIGNNVKWNKIESGTK